MFDRDPKWLPCFLEIVAGDFLCSGRMIFAGLEDDLLLCASFLLFFFFFCPKVCTYISRSLRRSSQRNSYVTIQMFCCSRVSLLSYWRQQWKKESTYREQKQTSGDTLQVADVQYFKVFKSHKVPTVHLSPGTKMLPINITSHTKLQSRLSASDSHRLKVQHFA